MNSIQVYKIYGLLPGYIILIVGLSFDQHPWSRMSTATHEYLFVYTHDNTWPLAKYGSKRYPPKYCHTGT